MKAGIVGLPNVGKSSLFNCLSNAKAQSANFPFCTIEPNIGVVTVPDNRLEFLVSNYNPQKIVPATVEIFDIAGLVKGASKGEGLGNKFLSNIRETDAIIHVLRCFENNNITHVEGSIDPIRDNEIIDTELQLKDLEVVEKKLDKIKNLHKSKKEKSIAYQEEILIKIKENLQNYINIRDVDFNIKDKENYVNPLNLLTNKPILYVLNIDEKNIKNDNNHVLKFKKEMLKKNIKIISLAVSIESEINEFEDYNDKKIFLEDLGLLESGSSKLIKNTYSLLELETFFTAGEKEVKAWTIKKGTSAPDAAGKIHSDIKKGFIMAEVIPFETFKNYKSEIKIKEAGKLKMEGKNYIVNDGDIINFKFNV